MMQVDPRKNPKQKIYSVPFSVYIYLYQHRPRGQPAGFVGPGMKEHVLYQQSMPWGVYANSSSRAIMTWVHCTLYDCNHQPQLYAPQLFLLRNRLVAHIDTGNEANTTRSSVAFQMLYPTGYGAIWKGFRTAECITGHSPTCPAV